MTRPFLVVALATLVGTAANAQCPDGSPPPCTRASPAVNTVAVLYFESRDTTDVYLAEGVSEEIATSLGRVPRLAVKIPSAVRRVQRANAGDVRAIARALDVRWLVEGSIRRSGEQLRVSVRLVDAQRETATWSTAFTRATRDLLAIQEEIAREVATGVVGVLNPVERAAVAAAARPTQNAQAYEHYLKGNWYMGRRGAWTERAVDEYRAAIRLDPTFAAPQAGIALAYQSAADYTGFLRPFGMSADSLRDLALALADSVIQRDPSVAMAWVARGAVLRRRERYTAARESFQRALRLDPNSAEAHYRLAQLHFSLVNFPETRASLQRAMALDPLRPVTYQLLGVVAYFERRLPDAVRLLDSALVLDPDYQLAMAWQAVVLHASGDTAAATAMARRRRAVIAELTPVPDSSVRNATVGRIVMIAHSGIQAMALLGRHEDALRALAASRSLGMDDCLWTIKDPAFDSVRRDPRFVRYEERCLALKEPQ